MTAFIPDTGERTHGRRWYPHSGYSYIGPRKNNSQVTFLTQEQAKEVPGLPGAPASLSMALMGIGHSYHCTPAPSAHLLSLPDVPSPPCNLLLAHYPGPSV